jgi:Ca2+-binding EF-hand superfamily protein
MAAVDAAPAKRYRSAPFSNCIPWGDYIVSYRFLSWAAAAALAGVLPALSAAAQTTAPQAKPAQAQANPTRAALMTSLQSNFTSLDTNKDGTLSQPEIAAAETRGLQVRVTQMRAQAEAQFTRLDTNKDGQLSKAEFMAAAPSAPAPATGANALAALDKNKDSKVSLDEFRAPMLSSFDRMDTNKDGVISPAERQAAQSAQTAQRR